MPCCCCPAPCSPPLSQKPPLSLPPPLEPPLAPLPPTSLLDYLLLLSAVAAATGGFAGFRALSTAGTGTTVGFTAADFTGYRDISSIHDAPSLAGLVLEAVTDYVGADGPRFACGFPRTLSPSTWCALVHLIRDRL